MSQLGHSLCRTPRGELRGFPCRRVVSMAVDAAIAVSWPVAEALAERLCRIMVWLLRLALMRATDLARADACGPTAGMLVRQPIDPPASARADTPGRPRHAPKNSVTLRSAQTPRGRRVPARWRLERCDKLPPPTAARRHRSPSSPRCTGRHTWDPNRTRCLRARRPPHRRVTHEPAPGPGSPRPLAFHYPATAPADPDHPQLRQPEPAQAHQAGADPHLPEPVELVVHRGGEQPAVGERQDPVEGVAG